MNTITHTSTSWPTIPSLGDLNSYITLAHQMPMLTADEEREYALSLRQRGCINSAHRLVLSHLRLVISTSRQYLGYGLPQEDLIQEGNVGLMKAVKQFDPDKGARLNSYALHWIKAAIHSYILDNWRMVKVATTKAQRKLFFNLRSMKNTMQDDVYSSTHLGHSLSALTPTQVDEMAKTLSVKTSDVREMEVRMMGGDVDIGSNSDDEYAPISWLHDTSHEPTRILESCQQYEMSTSGVQDALAKLDPRSRAIIRARWIDLNDGKAPTLHELAAQFNVSAERIRQIETQALKTMRKHLE